MNIEELCGIMIMDLGLLGGGRIRPSFYNEMYNTCYEEYIAFGRVRWFYNHSLENVVWWWVH